MWTYFFVMLFLLLAGCMEKVVIERETPEESGFNYGGANDFKVPVPAGFNWEVTQSWASHCGECEQRYHDWDYCQLSHTGNCCRHGIDFNLPGNADSGKSILASGDGVVRDLGYNNGWGNFVVLDHGQNVCSRYAHMLNGSNGHLSRGQDVCQGLKIGEIGNTGASEGAHLHFQFEECDSGRTLPMGFTDGNGVPICTRGRDLYDNQGRYNFLRLINQEKYSCDDQEDHSTPALPMRGWRHASCGSLSGCPLVPNCRRDFNHRFTDQDLLDPEVGMAALYLWSECTLNGKADGAIHQFDWITRAEALKIALSLFGLMENCGVSVDFHDVEPDSWYYPVVACGLRYQVINSVLDFFYPNREASFAEAAKMVVLAASRAGVIDLQDDLGHFPQVGNDHQWAIPYMETLYTYGGLLEPAGSIEVTSPIQRGEYIVIAASLSPCYCRNVRCDRACECEQSLYACVDPRDNDPGHGGEEEDEDDEVEEEYDPPPQCGPDDEVIDEPERNLDASLPVDAGAIRDARVWSGPLDATVVIDAGLLPDVSALPDIGNEPEVLVDAAVDMVIDAAIVRPLDATVIVDAYVPLDASIPDARIVDAEVDARIVDAAVPERDAARVVDASVIPDVARPLDASVVVDVAAPEPVIVDAQVPPEGPCVAYRLKVQNASGVMEARLHHDNGAYYRWDIPADLEQLELVAYCNEVPLVVRLSNDDPNFVIRAFLQDERYPEFRAWYPYVGRLTFHPDEILSQFTRFAEVNDGMLILIDP